MSEEFSDSDASELAEDLSQVVWPGGAEALFGGYSVLSPGVEIFLEGRPVSAPTAD